MSKYFISSNKYESIKLTYWKIIQIFKKSSMY